VNYEALLDRILRHVDAEAYLPLADAVEEDQRAALDELGRALQQPSLDVTALRARARQLHARGAIDEVHLYSALHVIAAHPRVNELEEAAEMAARQEMAALRMGGPRLQDHLASVERHRGVIAWLQGSTDVALDYFSRAFERQRSAGNLANVLACLLRLGDEADARDLLHQVRGAFPPALVHSLDDMIHRDPDLSLLRTEVQP
jgi:tetratricopeptide (TPR) repeat protein